MDNNMNFTPAPEYAYTPVTPDPDARAKGHAKAKTGMIFGIIALVLCFSFICYFPPASVICGIVGLVYAVRAKKYGYDGSIRSAALVTSVVGIIFGIIFSLLTAGLIALYVSAVVGVFEDFGYEYQEFMNF